MRLYFYSELNIKPIINLILVSIDEKNYDLAQDFSGQNGQLLHFEKKLRNKKCNKLCYPLNLKSNKESNDSSAAIP